MEGLLPLRPFDISFAVGAFEVGYTTPLAMGMVAPTVERDTADDAEALAELVVVVGCCGRGQGVTSPLFI